MFFRQEDMKNRITPIDITHMHTDVECGGVSHRYRRCTRMLRAEGKDVIRNLKKKSVVICDICGRINLKLQMVSPTDIADEHGCSIIGLSF